MPLAPGTIVARNLRLVRLLAEGGMGSVWIADHLGLKTQVAVKFIAESVVQDPTVKMRFEREATAAAQIRSPHVVQIFDHGLADDRIPYIVMELLEGESLGRRLDRLGALSPREAASIVGQVCRALSKAHANGVVHRDIKPDNIFLTDSDGELFVKVLDFGIAKRAADQPIGVTSTGMAVGTPLYMSPEQSVSAKDVTLSTDLWAVAAVAYKCLTGRVPFQGDTFGALCVIINRGVFPRPSTLREGIPQAFDAWFMKGLAVAPADRFVSARELADQFSAAAGFPPGVQVSVPSALPPRSGSSPVAATRADVPRAAAQTPISAQTATAHPSQPQGGTRDAMTTVQTGASIAGAELAGPAHEGGRPRRRTMIAFVAFAGFGALAAVLALSLRPVAPPESAANTGMVQGSPAMSAAPSAAPPEEKAPQVDLGAPGGATVPGAFERSSAEGEPGRGTTPLASAEPPKPPPEGRKKGSPAFSGASTSGGKAPARIRPRPPPTADPGRDLMEP
jgi:serine/threonine-protein kinase